MAKNRDSIINKWINVQRLSILLLSTKTHTADTRDTEKFFNFDITSVDVSINGIPNKVYSQGFKSRHKWAEVYQYFSKEAESTMNTTKFYTADKFALFNDLHFVSNHGKHGTGLQLVNTKNGVHLDIKRTPSGSGSIKCHIFIIADAQFDILNKELGSVQY